MIADEAEGKKEFRKRDWIIAILILVSVTILGSLLYSRYGTTHNPIPENIRQNVAFTPYYPAKLPRDWQIDPKSYISDEDAIIFKVYSPSSDAKLSFSIQPQVGDLDYDQFYRQSIKKSVRFSTSDGGVGIVGEGAGKPMGSLLIKDTWVLVSAISGDVTQSDIRQMLMNLKS